MSAFYARRDEDIAKLKELEKLTGGKVRVTSVSGNPISTVGLRVTVRTAADSHYPATSVSEVDAKIQLGARYPFEEPLVSLTTQVFNPNVYTSGRVCLGSKWLATEYLDLLARRLFKILCFDETIVNTLSAANGDAARWYIKAKQQHPSFFPSDVLADTTQPQTSSMKWTDKSQTPQSPEAGGRVVVDCPKCKTNLRVPAGKTMVVTCPSCKNQFQTST